jgi:hypothetical protein
MNVLTEARVARNGGCAGGGEDDLAVYLRLLFARAAAGEFVEVRWRLPDGMGQRFVPAGDLDGAAGVVCGLGDRTDVYVGVLPRTCKRGGRDAVSRGAVVWADCDGELAAQRLRQFGARPSLVVRSGSTHGLHAYWLLERPTGPDVIEALNRRLAFALGADPQSVDAARILRPPATLNLKREQPAPVTLADVGGGPVSIAELDRCLPDLPSPTRAAGRPVPRGDGGDDLRSIEPARYVQRLLGVEVPRSRKVSCPFHPDRTPSLHVYPAGRGWHCFGCGLGGDIYTLAGRLWGLPTVGDDFRELRARLRREFGLS